MKLINGPADVSGSIFPCGGEGRGSNPRRAYQDFLDLTSSFLSRSLTSSETDRYPSSGFSRRSFSICSNKGLGILAELYCDIKEIYMYENKNLDATFMWQYSNRSMRSMHTCNTEVAI